MQQPRMNKPNSTSIPPVASDHNQDPSRYDYLRKFSHPKGIPKCFLKTAINQDLPAPKPTPTQFGNPGPAGNVPLPAWVYQINQQSVPTPTLGQFQNNSTNEQIDFKQSFASHNEGANPEPPENPEADDSDSSEFPLGQKRVSAFQRLGPLTQPKKPKLIINLLFSKEKAIREVMKDDERIVQEYIPVPKREDVLASTDETVIKYLSVWPILDVNFTLKRTVKPRPSKSAMLMEEEQISEAYVNSNAFIRVSLRGFPPTMTKQDVVDFVLDKLEDKLFVPCFIEMTVQECSFFVYKCPQALLALHKLGLHLREGDIDIPVHISLTSLKAVNINFLPKAVLNRRLAMAYNSENKSLNLQAFTLQTVISNFIYFPLSRLVNRKELTQLHGVCWETLVDLNLSHNKLTNLTGFNLRMLAPNLKHLDVSYNYFENIKVLIPVRGLMLQSFKLEGNPLCHDFIDADLYTKIAVMLFPGLKVLDGVKLKSPYSLPEVHRIYCPVLAQPLVEKFIQTYFPIMDSSPPERIILDGMYHEDAKLSITLRERLCSSSVFRRFNTLFSNARSITEGNIECTQGSTAIAKLATRWPSLQHDPTSFVVDVLEHSETHTILKIGGIVKITTESLSDDEYMLTFSRTMVLLKINSNEYKIYNEMLYWEEPTRECASNAFKISVIKPKRPSVKLETPPNKDLKEKLIKLFMEITEVNRMGSERCLKMKDWDLRSAFSYFMELVNSDNLQLLNSTE